MQQARWIESIIGATKLSHVLYAATDHIPITAMTLLPTLLTAKGYIAWLARAHVYVHNLREAIETQENSIPPLHKRLVYSLTARKISMGSHASLFVLK